MQRYTGRFAPTPSGPLHLGSITTALGAYLRARSQGGTFIIRIEDLDLARTRADHSALILHELASLSLFSDCPILRQSTNLSRYEHMLSDLTAAGLTYRCVCTRSALRQAPCPCRSRSIDDSTPHNVCFDAAPWLPSSFSDILQGHCPTRQTFAHVVLRRKDGFFAYNLAVVCDDLAQGVTEIVRGADLLELSAVHIALFRALGAPVPSFLHLPLVLNERGDKYSKQNHARPVLEELGATATLATALGFLGQDTDYIRDGIAIADLLAEAVKRFDLGRIPSQDRVLSY